MSLQSQERGHTVSVATTATIIYNGGWHECDSKGMRAGDTGSGEWWTAERWVTGEATWHVPWAQRHTMPIHHDVIVEAPGMALLPEPGLEPLVHEQLGAPPYNHGGGGDGQPVGHTATHQKDGGNAGQLLP